MLWSEIRKAYPHRWLTIEALDAHTGEDSRRKPDDIAVVDLCPDGLSAMHAYRKMHNKFPQREFYFVHTKRKELDIRELGTHSRCSYLARLKRI